MNIKPQLIVVFGLMAVFCYALVSSWSFPTQARMAPWFAGIGGTAMCISYLVVSLLRKQKGSAKKGTLEAFASLGELRFRTVAMWFGSLAAVVVTTWLIGFKVAALLFVFSYMKLNGRGWFESVAMLALLALLLWGLFSEVLMMSFIEGMLPWWLGF
ncbi:tripartite tricarboxylate transporter TctB family protein [Chloroflexota bacterium]